MRSAHVSGTHTPRYDRRSREPDFHARFDDRDEQVYIASPEGLEQASATEQIDSAANWQGQYNYKRPKGSDEDFDDPANARDYTLSEEEVDQRADRPDPRESADPVSRKTKGRVR